MKMSECFSMPIRGEYERDYCDEYHYTIYDNCGDVLLPCLPEDVSHEAIVEAVNNHDTLTETNRLLNLECEELKGDVEKLENEKVGLIELITTLSGHCCPSEYCTAEEVEAFVRAKEILGD